MNIQEQLKLQRDLKEIGQSLWLDNINRTMLFNNSLKNLIDNYNITGLTSNPTIFENAITTSNVYDESLKIFSKKFNSIEEITYSLMIEDIQRACDLFMDIYKNTNGQDGYVSIEIPPTLNAENEIIESATKLYEKIGKPNVMIKIQSTREGINAMKELIKRGINVNMTLIFSPENYVQVAENYIEAIDWRMKNKLDTSVFSVASFFVSRIDTKIDKYIEDMASREENLEKKSYMLSLRGKAAISISLVAYSKYLELFFSENFKKYRDYGFKEQRILWASTSTKNPSYKDTLYVDELCLKHSINTLPQQTLYAFFEHGNINREDVNRRIENAENTIKELLNLSVPLNQTLDELQVEGINKFINSYQNILKTVENKINTLNITRKQTELEIYNTNLESRIKELNAVNFKDKLFSKDYTLWKKEENHIKIIKNALGWIDVPLLMQKKISEIENFVNEIIKEKYKYAVLLGMGGSSLAAEVMRSLFQKPSYPKLFVLDTTNPDWINDVEKQIKIDKTLFIFSSKSGSTVEPNSQFKYFYSKLKKKVKNPGKNFIAITDKNTSLEKLATKHKFRKIFINPSDIGGRFSALSYFGLVPAALCGVNIRKLLEKAIQTISDVKNDEIKNNTAFILGMFLAENYLSGKDKLTLILPKKFKNFGLWIEQLIAESTGKENKGILPVVETKFYDTETYGLDRMFVIIQNKDFKNTETESKIGSLIKLKFPVLKLYMEEPHDIAKQFYIWEIATATAGYFMKINPFDQPDVQKTKELTHIILTGRNKLEIKPSFKFGKNEIYTTENVNIKSDIKNCSDLFWEILNNIDENGYFIVCAYLNNTPIINNRLEELTDIIKTNTSSASFYTFGPRYLHSTGQLFKGGKNNGTFLILTAKSKKDIKILGENYTFEKLHHAQAKGDFMALKEKQRKAILLNINDRNYEKKLTEIVKKAKEIENIDLEKMEGNMPKALLRKGKKSSTRKTVKTANPGEYVVIDYPKHLETITSKHYTIRIGASECSHVEVSIDGNPWEKARHSVGYWWYDWNNIEPGTHEIIAKLVKPDGSFLISKKRRCKAA